MFEEVRKALGENWFRAFVVVLGCLWVFHTFFGSIAEVGQAINVTYQGKNAERREAGTADNAAAQGKNADRREQAIAESAVAEAKIKEATARETLRRQKAEADEAVARACNARMTQLTQNMIPDDIDTTHGFSVKPGTRTARMMAEYNKDCAPDLRAASDAPEIDWDSVIKSYQGLKKINKERKPPMVDRDASVDASCIIGARNALVLHYKKDEIDSDLLNDILPICSGAAIAYSLIEISNENFNSPHVLSKAPDDDTRQRWRMEDAATDIKQCITRKQNYTSLLNCSCIAGTKIAATTVIPSGNRTKFLEGNDIICPQITAKFAESDGPDAASKYREFIDIVNLKNMIGKINEEFKAGNYNEAYRLSKKKLADTEAIDLKTYGKAGKLTSDALASHSWYTLFAHQYAESLAAADRSITLGHDILVPQTNRAHALMMLGRTDEARQEYAAHKGEKIGDKIWEKVIDDDFSALRKAGITHPLMDEIEGNAAPPSAGLERRFPNVFSPNPKPAARVAARSEPINLPAQEDPDVVAVRQLKLAADRGDTEAQLNLGKMYEEGRGGLPVDPEEAARFFKLSADQGNAAAQVRLAGRYETGIGVPKDLQKAAAYYLLAANQGYAAGQSNLADAYEKGAGVPKNLCEAKRLRLLAAAQGEAYAIKNLNEMRVPSRCKNTIAAR